MPRDRAMLRTDMWGDADWRALSFGAQWLYEYLLACPSLNYVGVADWRPGRITKLTKGLEAAQIAEFGQELAEHRFVVIDEEAEEILVRSFLRHDGVLTNPNLLRSVGKDFAGVHSEKLQAAIARELNRLKDEFPNGLGKTSPWQSPELRTALRTPFETPSDTPSQTPSDTGSPRVEDRGSDTATATSTSTKERGAAKRGTRLTRFFAIDEEMRAWAAKETPLVNIDEKLGEFVDYWASVPGDRGVKLDWVATWRNGMRKQQAFAERDRPAEAAPPKKKFVAYEDEMEAYRARNSR